MSLREFSSIQAYNNGVVCGYGTVLFDTLLYIVAV